MFILSNKAKEIITPPICEVLLNFLEQRQKDSSYNLIEKNFGYKKYIRIGYYTCSYDSYLIHIQSFCDSHISDSLNGFPGYVNLSEFGELLHVCYYSSGLQHREDGPAMIKYKNGIVNEMFYMQNNLYHRLDGPAAIAYNGNNFKQIKTWYIKSKNINKDEFPIFENGKQVNDIVIDNAMKIKLMMFDREYFSYVMKIVDGSNNNG